MPIGPHRRYTWVDAELARFKAIKNALGGTLNDVVLAAVALALGRFLRRRGVDTDGLVLKAMVPVSVRADAERGALGNRVAAMWAPLPVGVTDPEAVLAEVAEAMAGIKESGQAVGAVALTSLADFAPPTIMSQAARLQARQRFFNLVVTNVPGPQIPLYLLGRRMVRLYPVVPLAQHQALGIAIMSYDGRLGFGLLGDYDAMPDLEALADDLRAAIDDLTGAAGLPAGRAPGPGERHRLAGRRRTPARAERVATDSRDAARYRAGRMRIALAQINATVGDIAGNEAKVREQLARAREAGAQLVLFPELAVTGYPPEDLLLKEHFLADARAAVERIAADAQGIVALVGFPERADDVYNAAAVLADGGVQAIYRKVHLPNYGVFDELRYFQRGPGGAIIEVDGVKVGLTDLRGHLGPRVRR